MRTVSRKRAAAALVTPLLLLGVTACNNDDTTPAASDSTPTETPTGDATTEPASEPTEDATDTPSGDEVTDAAGLFKDMQAAMKAAKSAKVVMDMGMGSAKGLISYGDGVPEMALTMDMSAAGAGNIEMRYVGGVMYMSMPPLTPPGKFFKFDSDSKTMGPLIDQMQSLTPDASTAMIAKSLKKITEAGEEKIGGDQTTHYVLEVDTAESLKLLGQTDLPQGAQTPTLPKTLEYDMWVTDGDLLRRIVMNVSAVSMQMDYTDWGKPVDIEAPDAGDIVKAPNGL